MVGIVSDDASLTLKSAPARVPPPMPDATLSFGWINWTILVGFLAATTWFGHLMRGRSDTLEGFFVGGRNVPWWAVSASLMATQTSALTFIAVPAFIFAPGGDLTYAQATLGFMLGGSVLMAHTFLPVYYRHRVVSPYDYIEARLGASVSQLARLLFVLGAVLSQGVRLLSTALVLSVVTGLPVVQCIAILGAFAAAWAWMGGITTVIWTDVVQYVLFLGGAVFALAWVLGAVPGGVAEVLRVADDHAKLRLLDLSLDPTKTFTLWAGLVGSSIFSLGQSSIDQVSTQRLMCCANIREAKKAMYGALFISVPTYLMLFVGLGLFAFYHHQPLPPDVAARFVEQPDRVYPYFIVSELPVGVSGLLIAAIFAAGISTLDSALAALSETTLDRGLPTPGPPRRQRRPLPARLTRTRAAVGRGPVRARGGVGGPPGNRPAQTRPGGAGLQLRRPPGDRIARGLGPRHVRADPPGHPAVHRRRDRGRPAGRRRLLLVVPHRGVGGLDLCAAVCPTSRHDTPSETPPIGAHRSRSGPR